jgi:hypothetical protein
MMMTKAIHLPDNNGTRTRLLNRLGMFQEQPHMMSRKRSLSFSYSSSSDNHEEPSVLGGGALRFRVKLKEDDHSDVDSNHSGTEADASSTSSSPNSTNSNSTSTVQFHETVSVVEIPSRYQYSNRIKKFIWSNSYEISEMAERNTIEFESEGYDWRNVVMDDDMLIDSINGELIHPCHYWNNDDDDGFGDDEREGDSKSSSDLASWPSLLTRSNSFK